jgi:hypothetical protein
VHLDVLVVPAVRNVNLDIESDIRPVRSTAIAVVVVVLSPSFACALAILGRPA